MPVDWVVVGLDNGGTSNNGTVLMCDPGMAEGMPT